MGIRILNRANPTNLSALIDSIATQNLSLTDNVVSGNGIGPLSGHGIYFLNRPINDNANATQSANLAGNTISGNNNNGLKIRNFVNPAFSAASGTQTISLTAGGNSITDNAGYGAFIRNTAPGTTGIQNVNLSGGNTFSGNAVGSHGQVQISSAPVTTVTLPDGTVFTDP